MPPSERDDGQDGGARWIGRVPPEPRPASWTGVAAWAFGLMALAALVAVVLHLGELERFVALTETARPEWLLLALAAQVATYVCQAAVWHKAVERAGYPASWRSLLPLGMAKLFADQALPTGGISGTLLMLRALGRRGLTASSAMAVMLVAMVSLYAAYLSVTLAGLGVLAFYHHADPIVVGAAGLLMIVALVVPSAILGLRHWRGRRLPAWLGRIAGIGMLFDALTAAPTHLLREPALLARSWALQTAIFVLDAATLWLMFRALGEAVPLSIAFAGFVMASVAATLAPLPGGLGSFEAGSVAMLTVLGVPLESALAATLLLRGITFWLPMLPGLWLARREMREG